MNKQQIFKKKSLREELAAFRAQPPMFDEHALFVAHESAEEVLRNLTLPPNFPIPNSPRTSIVLDSTRRAIQQVVSAFADAQKVLADVRNARIAQRYYVHLQQIESLLDSLQRGVVERLLCSKYRANHRVPSTHQVSLQWNLTIQKDIIEQESREPVVQLLSCLLRNNYSETTFEPEYIADILRTK